MTVIFLSVVLKKVALPCVVKQLAAAVVHKQKT